MELSLGLENISENLSQQAQNAMSDVGSKMLQDMRNFTPVRTGYLLSTESMEQQGMLKFIIYARATYARYVEYGHETRGHKSFVAGQFFMTRAFQLHENEVQQEILNAVYSLAETSLS